MIVVFCIPAPLHFSMRPMLLAIPVAVYYQSSVQNMLTRKVGVVEAVQLAADLGERYRNFGLQSIYHLQIHKELLLPVQGKDQWAYPTG